MHMHKNVKNIRLQEGRSSVSLSIWPVGDPPKRSEHAKGKRGRKTFHRHSKRAEWYKRATGGELSGSLEKQNHDFDRVARRYRAYSDYRAHERYTRERPAEQNEREQRERRCGEHADFD